MKKLIKGVLFLAIIGTIIVGCEKEETSDPQADNLSITKEKTVSNKSISSIRLDEGSYDILSEFSEAMGYQSITTSDATFDINYSNSNYGSAKIPLDNYIPSLADIKIKIKIKFAIYSRKKNCIHGVGLRCKLNKGTNQAPGELPTRVFDAELEVNEDSNTLDIEFLEYVDWELLND